MNRESALIMVEGWKAQGAEFELVGSLWRGKEIVDDIDILVKPDKAESVFDIVSANKLACEVELYIPHEGHYEGLLKALRAGVYRCINERLMAGLRFSKKRIGVV